MIIINSLNRGGMKKRKIFIGLICSIMIIGCDKKVEEDQAAQKLSMIDKIKENILTDEEERHLLMATFKQQKCTVSALR